MKNIGILLINLGTPDSPTTASVKKYLNEFLMDKRVINLPYLIRLILVKGIVVPFRSKKSAQNYQTIWTEKGSPLLLHTRELAEKLQVYLDQNYKVAMGMRYGNPSIEKALRELKDCEQLIIFPLYPQYASATTGSSIEKVMELLRQEQVIHSFEYIRDYFNHPAYIEALTKSIEHQIKRDHHLLLSYHGLPERQLEAIGCRPICQGNCSLDVIRVKACYRQQCFISSARLIQALGLEPTNYTVSFQSRLGKTPWIQPFTDESLKKLYDKGIRKLQIACPSFVADCLETLEEIAISAKEQWFALGGETFEYLSCLNSEPKWVEAIAQIIKHQGESLDN
jgi:protoporphyrin/coproporphyrin ferrochelatase